MSNKRILLSVAFGAVFGLIIVELLRVFAEPPNAIYVDLGCEVETPPQLAGSFYSLRFKKPLEDNLSSASLIVSREDLVGRFVSLVDVRKDLCQELFLEGLTTYLDTKKKFDLTAVGWSSAWLGIDGFSILDIDESSVRIRLLDHGGRSWRRVVTLLNPNTRNQSVEIGSGHLEQVRVAYQRKYRLDVSRRFTWLCKQNQLSSVFDVITEEDQILLQFSRDACDGQLASLFDKIQIRTWVNAINLEVDPLRLHAEIRLKIALILILVCVLFYLLLIKLKESKV